MQTRGVHRQRSRIRRVLLIALVLALGLMLLVLAVPQLSPLGRADGAWPGVRSPSTADAGPDSGAGKTGPGKVNDGGTTDGGTATTPTKGSGRFSAAGAGSGTIGSGTRLVRYRVEVESGVAWNGNKPWKPADFAGVVDRVLASPQGWTRSATSPVTDYSVNLVDASWSFRRVAGDGFDVRIRLATPTTVDRLCGEAGMNTEGRYSCRFGSTLMINLGRWLHGAPDFPVSIADYRANVINHEMGHFLGFAHMTCPGRGKLAPIMQTQTIDLGGCTPNAYPFSTKGRFVRGPWASSTS